MKRLTMLLRFLFRPAFLVCFGAAWMITNGWAYLLAGLGMLTGNALLLALSGAWLALLWLPFTPEKIVTLMIAARLLKRFFPEERALLNELLRFWEKEEKGRANPL